MHAHTVDDDDEFAKIPVGISDAHALSTQLRRRIPSLVTFHGKHFNAKSENRVSLSMSN